MLLKKVDLLESQTQQYKELVTNLEKADSINKEVLSLNTEYWETNTKKLNSQLKKTTRQRNLSIAALCAALFSLILIK